MIMRLDNKFEKLVLKARLKKKHLFSYQFKNFFSPKKTETISSNWIGINFKMFIQIFRLIFYKFNIHYHTLKCSLKYNLKYDTVGNIYKLLGKCSFKYFDKYFRYSTYSVILENVHWKYFIEHFKVW